MQSGGLPPDPPTTPDRSSAGRRCVASAGRQTVGSAQPAATTVLVTRAPQPSSLTIADAAACHSSRSTLAGARITT